MLVLFRKPRLVAGLALALAASSGVAFADSVSQDIVDARQERQIWTTFALNPHLRGYKLSALVQSGMARLTGIVGEDAEKYLAADITAEVKGVESVDNQIMVRPGYTDLRKEGDRSFAEAVDDAGITAEVRSKIACSKSAAALHALVDTLRGKVRLRGNADSPVAKASAGNLAKSTRGVGSVDNQLTVTGVSAPGAAVAAPTDSWMTDKVRTTLFYSIEASEAAIHVSTMEGVVTLTGRARNGSERALAIDLAQDVRGVRSVEAQQYTY